VCRDGKDNAKDDKAREVIDGYTLCSDKQTKISPKLVCDGIHQCPGQDKQDEDSTDCKENYVRIGIAPALGNYACVSNDRYRHPNLTILSVRCDGKIECLGGMDEENCKDPSVGSIVATINNILDEVIGVDESDQSQDQIPQVEPCVYMWNGKKIPGLVCGGICNSAWDLCEPDNKYENLLSPECRADSTVTRANFCKNQVFAKLGREYYKKETPDTTLCEGAWSGMTVKTGEGLLFYIALHLINTQEYFIVQ
jgi:hypothetical protein